MTENEITGSWNPSLSTPIVSICCITYNHGNYIADALRGFLAQQTDFPFEILIRDDASSDQTSDIIQEYAAKYPRIIKPIYEETNTFSQGVKPLAAIFKHAAGKYIAICEGDDYWTDPKKLQIQVDFLEKNPEYVITYHDCQPFNENGIIHADLGGAKKDLEAIELQQSTPIFTLTTCFRNIFASYPNEDFCSPFGDLFLWSVLGNYGKGKYIDTIQPAMYRIHDGGIFSKKSKQQKYEMTLMTDAALLTFYSRLQNEEIKQFYKNKMLTSWILSESYSALLRFALQYQKNRWKRKIISKLKKFKLLK